LSIYLEAFLIIIFTLAVGFFSGSETGLVSLNRIKLRHLVEARLKGAIQLDKLLNNPNRFLGTTLLGTNVCVIVATSLATDLAIRLLGAQHGKLVAIVIMSGFVLIFGEIVPKSYFRQKANKVMLKAVYPFIFISRLVSPLVTVLSVMTNFTMRIFGQLNKPVRRSAFVTRDELRYLIREGEKEGVIEPREGSIIYSIFDFGTNLVTKAMNPLKKLEIIRDSVTIGELKKHSLRTNFTRFPVRDKDGKIIGLVSINDCLYEEDNSRSIREFLRPIIFIDQGTVSDKALLRLRSQNQHMAIVVDKESKPVGYVTIEDMIEELVGDI